MRTKGAVSHVPVKLAKLNRLFGPSAVIMVSVQQYKAMTEAERYYRAKQSKAKKARP